MKRIRFFVNSVDKNGALDFIENVFNDLIASGGKRDRINIAFGNGHDKTIRDGSENERCNVRHQLWYHALAKEICAKCVC